MDIKGKGEKVWRKDLENERGKYSLYSVGVRSQRQDETWVTEYLPIKFAKKANAPDKISNGAKIDFEGFLAVDEYRDTKRVVIIAMSMKVVEDVQETPKADDLPDSFALAEEDCPF